MLLAVVPFQFICNRSRAAGWMVCRQSCYRCRCPPALCSTIVPQNQPHSSVPWSKELIDFAFGFLLRQCVKTMTESFVLHTVFAKLMLLYGGKWISSVSYLTLANLFSFTRPYFVISLCCRKMLEFPLWELCFHTPKFAFCFALIIVINRLICPDHCHFMSSVSLVWQCTPRRIISPGNRWFDLLQEQYKEVMYLLQAQ